MKKNRIRAVLSLGIVLGLGTVSTLAYWTDEAALAGGTFQAGTLDIKLDGNQNGSTQFTDSFAATNMEPGQSRAAAVQVQNAGTLPFNYSVSATGNGGLNAFLTYTVRAGGTVSGTTCTGGTQVFSGAIGTGTTVSPTRLLAVAPNAGNAESFCITATLPTGTTGGQGQTAQVDFTFNAKQVGAP